MTDDYIPTPRLRFIERPQPYLPNITRMQRILQQLWMPPWATKTAPATDGEWRDVPLEKP